MLKNIAKPGIRPTVILTHTLQFHSALAMIQGMRDLFAEGFGPRAIQFVAFDRKGDVYVEVPRRASDSDRLKVGNKLTLPWPLDCGHHFYLDAVHPITGDIVVVNGDRRIGHMASLVDVAAMVSWFVQEAHDESIFFGCTPHQQGSWWITEEHAEALHVRGFVDIVATSAGLLARRTMDPGLYLLSMGAAARGALNEWQQIFVSPLGNVLMLERRMLYDQLVLNCQHGLVEVDLYDLPRASESGRIRIEAGFAVVGRRSSGGFAVTRGVPEDWGLRDIKPATLVGSEGCSFMELPEVLRELTDWWV